MPKFSAVSAEKLATCHPDLQALCNEAIKHFDFTVLEGRRPKEIQEKYFREGKTKLHYPDSKHNANPPHLSHAVDIIPYPVDWRFESELMAAIQNKQWDEALSINHNIQRWFMFIGLIKGIASQMGIPIIVGADWDGDNQMADQRFDDIPHIELKDT